MKSELSDSQIRDALLPYGIRAEKDLLDQIRAYISLLRQWDRAVSLTAVTDPIEIVRFHFGESMFAAPAVPIHSGRLADVGSGAGFPGFPLRMAVPAIDLTIIESNRKKTVFLSEVVRALKFERVTIRRSRVEDFDPEAPFDFITARALGHYDELLAWAHRNLSQAGNIVLWLGEEDSKEVSRKPGWNWHPPVHIPSSKGRYILIGSPQR
ncbi:MAG: 16S rRNA (guanine(527)-N(7))-methyltransferase RsmG [Candidatus Acidiferrales bacterium]|jgi:16S rRNA (guanine527-N7)-methyltransferase